MHSETSIAHHKDSEVLIILHMLMKNALFSFIHTLYKQTSIFFSTNAIPSHNQDFPCDLNYWFQSLLRVLVWYPRFVVEKPC